MAKAEIFYSLLSTFIRIFAYIINKIAVAVQNKFYKNKIIFNTVWEDPRLDREALNIQKGDVIMTISSAGCNALSFLLDEPKRIYLVDRNPCQNALVELKIAAIKNLEYEQFWQLFGLGRLPNFSNVYYPILRKDLSHASQQFWDQKAFYFDGKSIKKSFYWRGTCGTVAWAVGYYFKLVPGLTDGLQNLLNSKTLKEQNQIWETQVKRRLWNPILNTLVRSPLYLSWTGIPIPQQELLATTAGEHKNIGQWIKDQIEYVATKLPVRENYFWRVYLNGEYTHDCCPDYLKEENFVKLKSLVDRISVNTNMITNWLQSHDEKINKFVLLDHMDWMLHHPDVLEEEWNAILDHANQDTTFLWRSAAPDANFVLKTNVLYKGEKTTLNEILELKEDLSDRLHKLDRVHTYTSLHIAQFKE
eukprot:TRINITY_DN4506_c0_g1_i1.p1 TRINITY_DN4506_c0_g1~~TRINITY_DN4506_c0_g1_i1.p1  ORF type:complete len:417 (-),score=63.87 TRINITY_DN4506_c0_g1_i1:57-1307(-)